MEKKREDILSKMLVKKEDTLQELEALVEMASKFIKIESESGDIFFSSGIKFTNRDKITLLLIGKYFSKELNLSESQSFSLGEISSQLNVPGTTLSKPVGQLVEDRILRREIDGKYSIVYHKIKDYLTTVSSK